MKMTTKETKKKLYEYCGDILMILYHMEEAVQDLQKNNEEKNKAMLRAAYVNLEKIEERVCIEEMRYEKMIKEDRAN